MEQYLISDAAKQVEVESHVLRYWEEELQLPIQRNKLGHRYYTEEDIERFRMIKKWKDQGLQLKAIRNALKDPEGGIPVIMDVKEEEKNMSHRVPRSATKGRGRKAKKNRQKISLLMQNNVIHKVQNEIEGESTQEEKIQNRSGQEEKMQEEKMQEECRPAEAVENVSVDTARQQTELTEDEKAQKAARLQFLLSQMMKEAVRSNNEELLASVQEMVVKEMDYQFRQKEERDQEREERRIQREEEHFRKIDALLRTRSEQAAEKKKKRLLFGLNG